MAVTSVDDLQRLLKRYEDIVFFHKHSIDSLEPNPQNFAQTLRDSANVWRESVGQLRLLLPQVTRSMLQEQLFTPLTIEIADVFEKLLNELEKVKLAFGPVTLEEAHDKLERGIADTLHDVEEVLRHADPNNQPYAVIDALLIQVEKPLILERSRISEVERLIEQGRSKPLPDEDTKKTYRYSWLDRFFNAKNQIGLLSSAFAATLLLKTAHLPLVERRPWIRVSIWALIGIWFLLRLVRFRHAVRQRKALVYAFSSILLASVAVLWALGSISSVTNTLVVDQSN